MTAPAVPSELAVYVDALGVEDARALFLALGGSQIYVPARPGEGSELVAVVGIDKARTLCAALGPRKLRVPLAKNWIARGLKAEDLSIAEIARTLHVSDVTVRKYLEEPSRAPGAKAAQAKRIAAAQDARQLKLL